MGPQIEDAETLAKYRGLKPDFARTDNDYNRFIDEALARSGLGNCGRN